jgi:hypothetical protein
VPTRATDNSFMRWLGFKDDPGAALARAQRLIPAFEGSLMPGCSHDMCFSQHRLVDTRILEFLDTKAGRAGLPPPVADEDELSRACGGTECLGAAIANG